MRSFFDGLADDDAETLGSVPSNSVDTVIGVGVLEPMPHPARAPGRWPEYCGRPGTS